MNPIFENLYETYGDTYLQAQGCYNEDEINADLDKLPLDAATKVQLDNLFFRYYYRWSTNAFALGIHLGLSLLEGR